MLLFVQQILSPEGTVDAYQKICSTEDYDPYENAIENRKNGILKREFNIDQVFKNHF